MCRFGCRRPDGRELGSTANSAPEPAVTGTQRTNPSASELGLAHFGSGREKGRAPRKETRPNISALVFDKLARVGGGLPIERARKRKRRYPSPRSTETINLGGYLPYDCRATPKKIEQLFHRQYPPPS